MEKNKKVKVSLSQCKVVIKQIEKGAEAEMMEEGNSDKQINSKNNSRGFQSKNSNSDQQNQKDDLIQSEKLRYKNADQIYE